MKKKKEKEERRNKRQNQRERVKLMNAKPEKIEKENEGESFCGDCLKKAFAPRVAGIWLRNRILLITTQATLTVTVLVVLAQFSDNSESRTKTLITVMTN